MFVVIPHDLLSKEDIISYPSALNKSRLHRIDEMREDSLDSFRGDFGNALVYGIATRNWPIVPNLGRIGDFRNKCNTGRVGFSKKLAKSEEIPNS